MFVLFLRYVPTLEDVEMYKSHKGPVSELHIVDRYMMEVQFTVLQMWGLKGSKHVLTHVFLSKYLRPQIKFCAINWSDKLKKY